MTQMTSRYAEGKGDLEGTGSNGEELQMLESPFFKSFISHSLLAAMTSLFTVNISLMHGFDYRILIDNF